MVDLVRLFTSVAPTTRPAAPAAPVARPPASSAATDGVALKLSPQARALLDQIAVARGEAPQESARPKPPGSRVNVVI